MLVSLAFLPLYIPLECFQSDTSNRGNKIAVRPKAWQFPLELGEFLTQVAAARSLDVLHEPMYPKLWITAYQQVYMIGHDFQFNQLLSPLLNGLHDNSFQSFVYGWYEHLTPILRTKHYMIVADIGYIVVGFQFIPHERSIVQNNRYCKCIYYSECAFYPPVWKARGLTALLLKRLAPHCRLRAVSQKPRCPVRTHESQQLDRGQRSMPVRGTDSEADAA